MTGNAAFQTPPVTLANLQTALTDFASKQRTIWSALTCQRLSKSIAHFAGLVLLSDVFLCVLCG
jgi:hypothetical protein